LNGWNVLNDWNENAEHKQEADAKPPDSREHSHN